MRNWVGLTGLRRLLVAVRAGGPDSGWDLGASQWRTNFEQFGPSADDQNWVDHRPAKGDRRQISNLVAVRGRMHYAAQVSGRGSPDRGCAGVHGCCRRSLVSGQ